MVNWRIFYEFFLFTLFYYLQFLLPQLERSFMFGFCVEDDKVGGEVEVEEI